MRGWMLVFSLAAPPRPAARPDAWLGEDKLKHFFSAAFLQSMGYGTLRAAGAPHGTALLGATVATTAASAGKELYDTGGRGTPSGRDLVWDAAGAGGATLLLVRVKR